MPAVRVAGLLESAGNGDDRRPTMAFMRGIWTSVGTTWMPKSSEGLAE